MVCMSWTGRGWPGSKLAKTGKEKQKILACNWPALAAAGWGQKLIKLAKEPRPAWLGSSYRVCILVQGLPWSQELQMKEKEDLIRTYGKKLIMEALRLSVTKKSSPDPFLYTSHWSCPWNFSLELPWNRSRQSVEVRLQYYSEPELCSRQNHLHPPPCLQGLYFACSMKDRINLGFWETAHLPLP